MNASAPLIPSDNNATFGIYDGNVNIFGNLTATTGTFNAMSTTASSITNLTATSGTFNTLTATTGTVTRLTSTSGSIDTISATTGSITNLSTTNLTGLSQFTVLPFSNTQFSTTTVTLSGSSVYNNLYYSNTSDPTFIKLPTSSSITTASSMLQDNPGTASDFWVMANTGSISLNENPPNVVFAKITGQTLTIPSNNIAHFKIYSPSAGIYQVFSLGITSYV